LLENDVSLKNYVYIQAGQDPTLSYLLPQPFNGLIEVISFVAITVAQLRIYSYKRQCVKQGPPTYKNFIQQMIISEIEEGSFASFLTDLCALLFLGLGFLAGRIAYNVPWQDFAKFPYYLLANYIFLIAPSFGALLITSMYFFRHKKLRQVVEREVRSYVSSNLTFNSK
jgi:hypothetical protein